MVSMIVEILYILLLIISPTATCTSGIVPESSHTNSASGTTQQEQEASEGEFEYLSDHACKKTEPINMIVNHKLSIRYI